MRTLLLFLLLAIFGTANAQYNIFKQGTSVYINNSIVDTLIVNGDSLCLVGGNCVYLPLPTLPSDSLYVNGDSVCLVGGNCIYLPSGGGASNWYVDTDSILKTLKTKVEIDSLFFSQLKRGFLYVDESGLTHVDSIGGIPTTYGEFMSNQGNWIFPAKYIIQDYRAIWKMQYTDSNGDGTGGDELVKMGKIEPLIVETISKDAINESTVKSIFYPNDNINYSLSCDGGDWEEDTKDTCRGFIYGRLDNVNQVFLNFDWRSVDQRRWLDTVSNVYNIFRKIDAQDTSLYRDFVALSPTAVKTKILGRGSPDNNYYSSNIVLRPYIEYSLVITKNGSDTVQYKNLRVIYNQPYLRDQITDMIDTGHVVYVFSGALPFPGTKITQILNDSMFIVNNTATSSDTTNALLTINFELVAVNDIYSMTNTTITNSFYDNRVHIVLNSKYKNFRFNQGISASGNNIEGFTSNNFNTINFVNAISLNTISATKISNSTFGNVYNVNFPIQIQSLTDTSYITNTTYLPSNASIFYNTKTYQYGNYGGYLSTYFNQNGTNNFYIPITSYADHSAANSDTDLVVGSLYRLNADNTIYIKE